MKNLANIVLLLLALAAPVVLFLLLQSHFKLQNLVAAAIAVAVGWALNIAWALSTQDESQKNLSIAKRFGWACPAGLVLITWVIWHFVNRAA